MGGLLIIALVSMKQRVLKWGTVVVTLMVCRTIVLVLNVDS